MVLPEPLRGFIPHAVVRREDVTEDLAVFRLRSPEPLPFESGQALALALPNADGIQSSAPSIVSAPTKRGSNS
jgi:ferredoxin-NADP reductase